MRTAVDRAECEAPPRHDEGGERRQVALEGAWRANPEERPHPEAEIECARVQEQPFQDILVATDMRAAEAAGLVKMRERSLEQFSAPAEEPFAATALDA